MHHCNEFYRYVSLGGEDIWKSTRDNPLTEDLKG
jgi:hypothetical protein